MPGTVPPVWQFNGSPHQKAWSTVCSQIRGLDLGYFSLCQYRNAALGDKDPEALQIWGRYIEHLKHQLFVHWLKGDEGWAWYWEKAKDWP